MAEQLTEGIRRRRRPAQWLNTGLLGLLVTGCILVSLASGASLVPAIAAVVVLIGVINKKAEQVAIGVTFIRIRRPVWSRTLRLTSASRVTVVEPGSIYVRADRGPRYLLNLDRFVNGSELDLAWRLAAERAGAEVVFDPPEQAPMMYRD